MFPAYSVESRRTVTVAQAIAALTSKTAVYDETGQTGSPVSSWAMSSGSADSSPMTQSTAGLRPAASTINGLAAPSFDGIDDKMIGTTNHMNGLLSVSAYEYFLVFKATAITATDVTDPRNDHAIFSDASGFIWCTLVDVSGTKKCLPGHRDSSNKFVTLTGVDTSGPHIVCVSFNGSRIRANMDGGADQTVTAANCGGMTATNVVFGQNLSAYYSGLLGTAIFCQAEQSSGVRANLIGALKTKYGIP